ncbi:hypothetical protein FNL39_101651 [Nocardia caishijiensis]|uniref:Uncharacterized protein n=1 Tax=Nocardia caishijiensis TaxID=184756 RepID=A0ABQ6YUJ4_9NOCA|nr:hypothetical protein FNL39_101651 [Nocardia caishijiensis]
MVNRPPVDPRITPQVLAYLESAPVILSARSYATDDFDPGQRDVPLNYQTDGVFVWAGAVPHYLRKYGVPPEPSLVRHIVAKGFVVGEVDDATLQAAVRSITG